MNKMYSTFGNPTKALVVVQSTTRLGRNAMAEQLKSETIDDGPLPVPGRENHEMKKKYCRRQKNLLFFRLGGYVYIPEKKGRWLDDDNVHARMRS